MPENEVVCSKKFFVSYGQLCVAQANLVGALTAPTSGHLSQGFSLRDDALSFFVPFHSETVSLIVTEAARWTRDAVTNFAAELPFKFRAKERVKVMSIADKVELTLNRECQSVLCEILEGDEKPRTVRITFLSSGSSEPRVYECDGSFDSDAEYELGGESA